MVLKVLVQSLRGLQILKREGQGRIAFLMFWALLLGSRPTVMVAVQVSLDTPLLACNVIAYVSPA